MHSGIQCQLLQCPCSCLQVEASLVGDHRILRNPQPKRHLLNRSALRKQFEHLPFPIGKIPSSTLGNAFGDHMVAAPSHTVQLGRDYSHTLCQ